MPLVWLWNGSSFFACIFYNPSHLLVLLCSLVAVFSASCHLLGLGGNHHKHFRHSHQRCRKTPQPLNQNQLSSRVEPFHHTTRQALQPRNACGTACWKPFLLGAGTLLQNISSHSDCNCICILGISSFLMGLKDERDLDLTLSSLKCCRWVPSPRLFIVWKRLLGLADIDHVL